MSSIRGSGAPQGPQDFGVEAEQAGGAPSAAHDAASAPVVRGGAPAREMTALQKHAAFFDGNKDGTITRAETNEGLRALGLAPITAFPIAIAINAGLGKSTGGGLLDVKVANIHLGKHGADTDAFDTKGRFNAAKLEEIFQKHDKDGDGQLSLPELDAMITRNRADDPTSTYVDTLGARGEWFLLFDLAAKPNERGEKTLTRAQIQGLYDGTLFDQIKADRAKAAELAGTSPLHGDVGAGVTGLAQTVVGIFGGAAAGARVGAALTAGEDTLRSLASPLTGAMQAVCPGPRGPR